MQRDTEEGYGRDITVREKRPGGNAKDTEEDPGGDTTDTEGPGGE